MEDDLTLGRTLRQARESRKLTLGSIAATTRISQPVLESIESDSLAGLPADVYVKGFVRAYCRVVELPEKPALELLERALLTRRNAAPGSPGGTPEEIGRPMMSVEPVGTLGKHRLTIIGVIGAVAVLVLIYVFMR